MKFFAPNTRNPKPNTHAPISLRRVALMALALPGLVAATAAVPQQSGVSPDAPDSLTAYRTATVDDAVARLQARLDRGDVKLSWNDDGYRSSVLHALGISSASQCLVFSRTSLQRDKISPRTPRAVFFNDSTYVGWCVGGDFLEIASVDKRWGTVFYTLEQKASARPRFVRQTDTCLQCHQSSLTQDVPGLTIRSVYATADGTPDFSSGSKITDDRSDYAERWGGWYVTGGHGSMRHAGNAIARITEGVVTLDRERGANRTELRTEFDTAPYLSEKSDIVALLVLTHQSAVHTRMTKTSFLVRDALRDEARMNDALGETGRRESTTRRIASAIEPLVETLLFSGEPPLPDALTPSNAFARQFAGSGRRDKKGRTLRELDLKHRLLRYPCSWLIDSAEFDALPNEARAAIWARLGTILRGDDKSPAFAHLTPNDRTAITEILTDLKPEFGGGR